MSPPLKPELKHLLYMAQVVEARDLYTAGHLWRVAQFTKIMAKHLRLSKQDVFQLSLGAYLHDFGKINVPDQVLNKKARLNDAESRQIQVHSEVGFNMLCAYEMSGDIANLALYHHEHWDGCGYPRGLSSEAIPFGARIITLCDALDAITSNRPYRKGMSVEDARELINNGKGVQFDPELVDIFLSINKAELLHVIGHSDLQNPLLECPVCGPVIEMPQEFQATTFCRVCSGKFNVMREKTGLVRIEFANRYGSPKDLLPKPSMQHLQSIFSEFTVPVKKAKSWVDRLKIRK